MRAVAMCAAKKRRAAVRKPRVGTSPELLKSLAQALTYISHHLAERAPHESKSIMIVEDDDDARDILASVLEHAGYSTVRVSNGKDALAKLRKIIPSLI